MMTQQITVIPSSTPTPLDKTVKLNDAQKIGTLRVAVSGLIEMASRLQPLSALDRATIEHAKHAYEISKVSHG